MSVFRTKSVEQSLAAADEADHHLKRRLSALDLVVFGIGVIIGAGIFTVTGRAAQQYAGPAVVYSFIIGAVVCGLAALCYAEFASTVPVSGSAYTFSYATLGEIIAWAIGWDLLLELMLGASVVAQGWSTYFVTLLDQLGIMSAAALVFFAYIGFDVVATTAEEANNPQRDLPRGILGSLVICTILYVAVALVITGMQPYNEIDPKAALANAFIAVGKDGYATLISAGAVAGLTTVVMTLIIGATRVTFAMSRDRLLPPGLGVTNPKTGTPVKLTLMIGAAVAVAASITPIGTLEEMVNIGTLSAFILVSLAVPILRKKRPDLKRAFKVPGNPWIPWLSAACCFYLILNLSLETWIRFLVWMAIGFVIYFLYSKKHSRLETEPAETGLEGAPEALKER